MKSYFKMIFAAALIGSQHQLMPLTVTVLHSMQHR